VPVVRRHVYSERRWHRDYLLAHLARNRGSLPASRRARPARLRPWLPRSAISRRAVLSAFRIASRIAGDHSLSGSGSGRGSVLSASRLEPPVLVWAAYSCFIPPGAPSRPWQLIRFRRFRSSSLALASPDLACRDHRPDFFCNVHHHRLTTAACSGLGSAT
jgi:hypothetical protein